MEEKEDYKEMDEKKGLQGTCKKRENYKENGKKIKINHQVFLKQLKNSLPQRNIYKRKDYKEMEKKERITRKWKKRKDYKEMEKKKGLQGKLIDSVLSSLKSHPL